jgi:hypothetical protein
VGAAKIGVSCVGDEEGAVVLKSCPDAAESVGEVERAFLSKGGHRRTENINGA